MLYACQVLVKNMCKINYSFHETFCINGRYIRGRAMGAESGTWNGTDMPLGGADCMGTDWIGVGSIGADCMAASQPLLVAMGVIPMEEKFVLLLLFMTVLSLMVPTTVRMASSCGSLIKVSGWLCEVAAMLPEGEAPRIAKIP